MILDLVGLMLTLGLIGVGIGIVLWAVYWVILIAYGLVLGLTTLIQLTVARLKR